MKPRSLVWVISGLFAVVLGVVVGGFVRAGHADPSGAATVKCRADFPVTGITGRERAVVHAAWVDSTGDPINARITFFDKRGQVLLEQEHALSPGETVSSELRRPKPRGEGEGEGKGGSRDDNDSDGQPSRLEFRAAVVLTTGGGEEGFPAATGCPGVLVSLERLSSKGETEGFVPPGCAIGHMCEKHEHEREPSPCPICSPPPGTDGAPPGTDGFPLTDLGAPPADLTSPPADLSLPPPTDLGGPPA